MWGVVGQSRLVVYVKFEDWSTLITACVSESISQ